MRRMPPMSRRNDGSREMATIGQRRRGENGDNLIRSSTLSIDLPSFRARTAINRTDLSKPVTQAIQDGIIIATRSVLDYGCGRGGDVARLSELGYRAVGWDPVFAPEQPLAAADIVNLGYVVNVIESPEERVETLRRAWNLTTSVLVVAARLDWEAHNTASQPVADGIVTRRGTFQKFYAQHELKSWIESILGCGAHAAAPGVFYVFRNPADAESLRARQVRRPSAVPRASMSRLLYEQHTELLHELASFLEERGRLPDVTELNKGELLLSAFGTIRQAFRILCRATGRSDWSAEAALARNNILVYLALSAFAGRPRMGTLPIDIQRDIKEHFGSYRAATAEADRLLFSLKSDDALTTVVQNLPIGKILPDAVYFHASVLPELPSFLRVYEGCAKALVGSVSATVIKLHRQQRKVSYLFYPDFEKDPHPALNGSLRVDLQTFDIRFTDFRESANPPILHRKETLIARDHPLHQRFAKLTSQEERADLLGVPGIGTRNTWNKLLEQEGWRLAGHRLLRRTPR
jgi:DNA phosphorothioation-associated putative methyltransferase